MDEQLDNIVLPSGDNTHSDLISSGVEDAISQNTIKPVVIKSASEVEYPSYLLDMSNVKLITEESLRALEGLISGGDTAVYIKNNNIIGKIGYGKEYELYTVLDDVIKHMFDGRCEVYKNRGKGFEPLTGNDITFVRLNL